MINVNSSLAKVMIGIVQHYNETKYWKMRNVVINSNKPILTYWYLFRIKRIDAFNNASLGTNIGFGAVFKGIPKFPHGLYGIIVSPYAQIGKNVRIFHQVTIGDDGQSKYNAPTICDNVFIYPGAKIIGKCKIGEGAIIGTNAVVSFDVPPKAIVTAPKPIIHYR